MCSHYRLAHLHFMLFLTCLTIFRDCYYLIVVENFVCFLFYNYIFCHWKLMNIMKFTLSNIEVYSAVWLLPHVTYQLITSKQKKYVIFGSSCVISHVTNQSTMNLHKHSRSKISINFVLNLFLKVLFYLIRFE